MLNITLIPASEFNRVRNASLEQGQKLSLIADMCRLNALAAIKQAGSGHPGTSLSSLDIVTLLYYGIMNTVELGIDHPDRDIYFSSKGHDVPGLYAVLHSLGILPDDQLIKLRQLGGPCGHPDVSTAGIEANSGSLGMGLAKAKGMLFAKRYQKRGGHLYVMTGDGELQEGQIYESLQTIVNQKLNDVTVIVDHNKVQSDKLVAEISDLGDLAAKFKAFGWHVARCDGHDFEALAEIFTQFRGVTTKPKILIADTLKGRGVSFMEHPYALEEYNGLYPWHSGAPNDEAYLAAYQELLARINQRLTGAGLAELSLRDVITEETLDTGSLAIQNMLGEPVSLAAKSGLTAGSQTEYVTEAFGEALVEIAPSRPDLIVLDADLAADCRLRTFEEQFPERFIENGIAEQDMVSMAGGLALQGLLPVVNSFGSFLAARANEQIYNNAGELTRIIYVCHYAGLIPAGPGQSHQSLRDISLFGALPNVTIVQPVNAVETKALAAYCINQSDENCVIRLIIGPSPQAIQLPENYALTFGQGTVLTEGEDAVLFAYGPIMVNEALQANQILAEQGFGLKVVNMPWLNRIDHDWLRQVVGDCRLIAVVEDHAPTGGLGDRLLEALNTANLDQGRRFAKFAVEGYPAWGTPDQVLAYHRLNAEQLSRRIGELAGFKG